MRKCLETSSKLKLIVNIKLHFILDPVIRRDRSPFVLTPDMVYVINGGDRMTDKFHTFVDLCCSAFNTLRRHGNLLLTLFALMATSGIPGVTNEAVSYIQQTLLLDLSNEEAAAR